MSRLSAVLFTLSGLSFLAALALWIAAVWAGHGLLLVDGGFAFITGAILGLAAFGHDILAEQ